MRKITKKATTAAMAIALAASMVVSNVSVVKAGNPFATGPKEDPVTAKESMVSMQLNSTAKLKLVKKGIKKFKVKWTSSNESVATVNKKGKVTTHDTVGTCFVTANVEYFKGKSKKAKNIEVKFTVQTENPNLLTSIDSTNCDFTMPYDTTTNIGDARKVTFPGGRLGEITVYDNGTMRKDLSAQYIIKNEMGTGINIGNKYEAVINIKDKGQGLHSIEMAEQAWEKSVISKEFIDSLHAYGINTVRIPVAWTNAVKLGDETYTINEEYMGRVAEVVNLCLNNGMYVMINDHWDDQWWGGFGACKLDANGKKVADEALRAKAWTRFEAYWTQIAEYFKDYSDHLLFAAANEELGARLNDDIYPSTGMYQTLDPNEKTISGNLTSDELYDTTNKINQCFVDIVRATGGNNQYRFLVCPGWDTNVEKTCDDRYKMPKDIEGNGNERLFVEVHCYNPWSFCGDGGNGLYNASARQGMLNEVAMVKKFTDQGYGVIFGEGGVCNPLGVQSSVTQWFYDAYKAAYEVGAVFCMWETGSYFDRETGDLKFKDVADFYNAINKTKADASQKRFTGAYSDNTEVIDVTGLTPVWSWEGKWYKNGGDNMVGEDKYTGGGYKGTSDADFNPENKVTATIEGDTTEFKMLGGGYQAYVKLDLEKYKNPVIYFTFLDGTYDPEIIGGWQVSMEKEPVYVGTYQVNYDKYANKGVVLDSVVGDLFYDTNYMVMAFTNKPCVTGIYIYEKP